MRVELGNITFNAILVGKSKFHNETCIYNAMRMACYPLTKQDGESNHKIQFWLEVDGQVIDVVEQNQLGVSCIEEIDMELAKYYFLLHNFEDGDYKELVKEYGSAEVHPVRVKLSVYEVIKDV